MTNTFTITQAVKVASSPEKLQGMELAKLEELVKVLASSSDKKVTRKLDMVKGILEAKRKDAAPEEKAEIQAVENSVKVIKRTLQPKADAQKSAQDKADKEAEKAAKLHAKKEAAEKAKADKAAKLAAKKAEQEAKAKEDEKAVSPFPEEGPNGMKRIDFESVADAQKVIMERPYQLVMYMQEKGRTEMTLFSVLYINKEVMVLLDVSVEVNSVVPIDMTMYKNGTVVFDDVRVPVGFYLPPTK